MQYIYSEIYRDLRFKIICFRRLVVLRQNCPRNKRLFWFPLWELPRPISWI